MWFVIFALRGSRYRLTLFFIEYYLVLRSLSFSTCDEAYSDAVNPAKDDMHELSAYTDACWGS